MTAEKNNLHILLDKPAFIGFSGISSLWSSTLILNSAYPGVSVRVTCIGIR